MNNAIKLNVLVFPVTIRDERTGTKSDDTIILTKNQLRAAQTVGQSSKELIYRLCNREGYRGLDIGKPKKREILVDIYAHGDEIVVEGDGRLDR